MIERQRVDIKKWKVNIRRMITKRIGKGRNKKNALMDVFVVEPNINEYFSELMNRQKDILMDAAAITYPHKSPPVNKCNKNYLL